MAAGAVLLGSWISGASGAILQRTLLALTAFMATGFGNVVNDIMDVKSDSISHPERPIPSGRIGPIDAVVYAILLAAGAISCSLIVGPLFAVAALAPIVLLTLYAFCLKGTPLAGNIIVSLLVAYSLVFGSLEAARLHHLLIPALLAVLLNFSREIIKDVQDRDGDSAANITTSAALSRSLLQKLLVINSLLYGILITLPWILGHFGAAYLTVCLVLIVPYHIRRTVLISKPDWDLNTTRISRSLKIEMLLGFTAMAIDRIVSK